MITLINCRIHNIYFSTEIETIFMILIIFGCNSFAIPATVVAESLKSHCPLVFNSTTSQI